MKKGFMVVFDGSNGAGKTTVIQSIEKYLISKGVDVLLTREPGGTPIGEKIRDVILDPKTPEMSFMTELMLFGAGRAQHIQEKIIPALSAGKVVISDRFDAATFSFQHYARGIDIDTITKINDLALNGFSPDMNIILDLDPAEGLKRVQSRGEGLDRLEDEKADFLIRARNGYLKQAEQSPEKFEVVDAAQSKEKVLSDVINIIDVLLSQQQEKHS
ncbi:dTMP kinase [Colwellia sp. 1_MG-2023]|uniref:dTMP kinase n=1 Tax=unclassified Colwellia TaxID=196834 RepID=UPI001C09E0D6|nr:MULTISPECIES: dTMP kinase [unclassified Colwellia]MBU2924395.1 dTMP kinase [Colwellia sp. C2M11]MDO6650803.1 dTMP kinase [Colwellia sp. 3_MG-2023]MDO6663838.1 dTMP kinase [Colwellia sp. 2_MG-2023]MDO6688189.1 dTMP kinase [Colwellia sp. 1_MG-2023]